MAATIESPAARATALLRRFLTPEQRASYDRDGWFDVVSEGDTFRIFDPGSFASVFRLDRHGDPVSRYCSVVGFNPATCRREAIPSADECLAQLLHLRESRWSFHSGAQPWQTDRDELDETAAEAKIYALRRRIAVGSEPVPPIASPVVQPGFIAVRRVLRGLIGGRP